jgi:cob(I)alamin adenosyltransferase
MKIYTKKGDSGLTGILGGTRLPKAHLRIEAYGTVDELNASIGLLRDHLTQDELRNDLLKVQEELFTIGAQLASDPAKNKMELPMINESNVSYLERRMDEMEAGLPEMKSFILPGGHPNVSLAHLCRTICRRAERHCVGLSTIDQVNPLILQYLNRLSDYFFVLSRHIGRILGIQEIPWRPRK